MLTVPGACDTVTFRSFTLMPRYFSPVASPISASFWWWHRSAIEGAARV